MKRAQEREHILEGLKKALDHLDEVISLIRKSKTPEEAKAGLIKKFDFSDLQAQAILEMRLQRLTGLERQKILDELKEVQAQIKYLKELLEDEEKIREVIKQELLEIKEKYGDERRTEIIDQERGDQARGPDRGGGDGGHHLPRGLHQAQPGHAFTAPSGAAARARRA